MSERVVYTGHFLMDSEELLTRLPSRLNGENTKIYAHHVTKEFRPQNGIQGIEPGRKRTLLLTGYVVAEGIHAAIVESLDDAVLTVYDHPHLTIATAEGIAPINSGEVVGRAKQLGTVIPIEPPIEVQTVEGYYDGRRIHTS